MHVLFLCRGNICRSPTAEVVFRAMANAHNLDHTCESAGTGSWHVGEDAHPPSKAMALQHGYSMKHRARHVTRAMLDAADLITVPDQVVIEELVRQYSPRTFTDNLYMLRAFADNTKPDATLEDPYFSGNYEKVLREVEAACAGILAVLPNRSAWPPPVVR